MKLRVAQFLGHVLFKLGTRHTMAISLHVFRECRNNAVSIHCRILQRRRQIKQVAPLLALIQRPQLGPQQFVEFITVNLAFALEPA